MKMINHSWQDERGFACIYWPNNNQAFFSWPDQKEELLSAFLKTNTDENTYVSWCLFDQPSRKAEHAKVVPGILFDIDLATGKHASSAYPESAGEALALIAATDLSEPSAVIHSGGGLYAHYLFDEPFVIRGEEDRRRVQAVLKGAHRLVQLAFQKAGYKLDNVSDLARVTRPVGAINHKYGKDTLVSEVSSSEKRVSIGDLERLIGLGDVTPPTGVTFEAPLEGKGKFEQVEQHCKFVRGMISSPHDVTEPEWYAAATIAAHCEDGEERFHKLSSLDAGRYSEQETAAKLRQARRYAPRTCAGIENDLGCNECGKCPFKAADIRSPYGLAFGNAALLPIQAEYILAADTDTYQCIKRSEPPLSSKSFDNQFAHLVKNPHRSFISDRRSPKVKIVDYLPGEDRLIVDVNGVSVLNAWQEGGVLAQDGDCSIILDHLTYLIPEAVTREWFFDYCAHLLQKPSIKIQSGVSILGGQGVGKSFLGDLFVKLLGTDNVLVDTGAQHASDYKASLGNRQLLIFEEMAITHKREASNDLKPWYTSDKVLAHEKYVRSHLVRSPRGILTFSNRSIPIHLEGDDRRNLIIRVDAPPRESSYYKRLWDDGLRQAACFKMWLLKRDISHWSAAARPPMTDAKQDIISASLSATAMEIREVVLRKGMELVTSREVFDWLNPPGSVRLCNLKQVVIAFHELGFARLPETKVFSRTIAPWATCKVEEWKKAGHAERVAHLESGTQVRTLKLLEGGRDSHLNKAA